jgi:hypothetical protein
MAMDRFKEDYGQRVICTEANRTVFFLNGAVLGNGTVGY